MDQSISRRVRGSISLAVAAAVVLVICGVVLGWSVWQTVLTALVGAGLGLGINMLIGRSRRDGK